MLWQCNSTDFVVFFPFHIFSFAKILYHAHPKEHANFPKKNLIASPKNKFLCTLSRKKPSNDLSECCQILRYNTLLQKSPNLFFSFTQLWIENFIRHMLSYLRTTKSLLSISVIYSMKFCFGMYPKSHESQFCVKCLQQKFVTWHETSWDTFSSPGVKLFLVATFSL